QKIIEAASSVISNNQDRREKVLWTQNPIGDPLCVWVVDDEYTEAEFIVREIKSLCKEDNYQYDDCAIFYRVNALSRVLEDVLRKHKIAYQVFGGFRFYERKEIKDLLAYLRLAVNPHDSVSFSRVINIPSRKIGKSTLEKITTYAQHHELSYYSSTKQLVETDILPKLQRNNLDTYLALIESTQNCALKQSPSQVFNFVCHESQYKKWLELEGSLQSISRLENLEEFSVALLEYEENSPAPSLSEFLQQITLASDIDGLDENTPTIKLLTAHAAKGLEFPVVFIVGMEEGLLPHSQSLQMESQLEEERRLFYVGITRAQKKLYLTRTKYRRVYGSPQFNAPSRFLGEIPSHLMETLDITEKKMKSKELISDEAPYIEKTPIGSSSSGAYRKGEKVFHPAFGAGTIQECSDGKATIEFNGGMLKKFVLAFTPLEKL
ncbi:MAG: ATP-binding domain-containing protein, partial [Deltaproteobacteria bacterium]|nr:ATP-binding domain-containing protein [Deltaproteobacteria bacterium]